MKHDRAYILYANESYIDIVTMCAKSIKAFSDYPIYVFLLNTDKLIDGVLNVSWNYEFDEQDEAPMYVNQDNNFYVNRSSKNVFNLIKERPRIIKYALNNFANNVCYVDCDSIVTKYIDRAFDMFKENSIHPYFTEGIYEFLMMNGRGGASTREDLSSTLEAPICDLFHINQYNRKVYRTSNLFVAGQNCLEFLKEWYWIMLNPKILDNPDFYCPFQDETAANALLWKYGFNEGLPYSYCNGDSEKIDKVYKVIGFNGTDQYISEWFKIPSKKENLLAFHGQKNIAEMQKMLNKLKQL